MDEGVTAVVKPKYRLGDRRRACAKRVELEIFDIFADKHGTLFPRRGQEFDAMEPYATGVAEV